jgi:hypothetical protein
MARAKPSNWQPGGIELLEVSELYPDADLRAIVGRIGRFEGNRYDAVESNIFAVAAWLNASLHYDSRPTASEKRAALSPITAKLAELRKAFAALDQDTVALLKGVAGRAAYGLQAEPPDFAPLSAVPVICDMPWSWSGWSAWKTGYTKHWRNCPT